MKENDIFIFTEAFGCGIVLKKCLQTFHQHHNEIVHIYGTPEDFNNIDIHENNRFIDISDNDDILEGYNYGHKGTSMIFAKAIQDNIGKYIIHFDSDVIFLDNCIDLLKDKIKEGYHLIGPYRCYKNNPHDIEEVKARPDVIQTCIMAADTRKINTHTYDVLSQMCVGRDFTNKPIIDFFDPVSFEILDNGGKPYYFDAEYFGGWNADGIKSKKHILNEHFDYGDRMIYFAGVGSGYKFSHTTQKIEVPEFYVVWAKKRWALYSKLFFDNEFPDLVDYKVYNDCMKIFQHPKAIVNDRADLSDVTLIMPVLIDSNDRIKNLATNIRYLLKNFNINILISEQTHELVPKILSFAAGEYDYISVKHEKSDFIRGTLFNEMIKRTKTDIILNYDCDVLLPSSQCLEAAHKLRNGTYDYVYPYDDNFYDISQDLRDIIFKEADIDVVVNNISEYKNKGKIKRIGPQDTPSVGGAIMINRKVYINGGMENEKLLNWAADDHERLARYSILGYRIGRVSGDIYHMHHASSPTSANPNHPYHKSNEDLIHKIKNMSKKELIEEIRTWSWCKEE